MGWFGTMMQALSTGWNTGLQAARRVYEDPETSYQEQNFVNRAMQYHLLWAYYNNSMFEKLPRLVHNLQPWGLYNPWQVYRSNYNLYRDIRMIYNPTKRLVDFYAGQVYPGVLSEDGSKLPDGVPLAMPFADDMDKRLKDAVAQLWQWWNWQAKKSVHVRYGAALGSVLIEAVDDLERAKIGAQIWWPGFVYDLELDDAGNVKAYALRYQANDDEQGSYLYEKQVDAESFRYFRDGEPYDYGSGAVVDNPYGFAPAVWIKHADNGGDHGSPAIAGSFGKIDELNSLASHVHDQIHKVIGAPAVLAMPPTGNMEKIFDTQKRGPTESQAVPSTDRESVLLFRVPVGTTIESLVGDLDLSAAAAYMTTLQTEIEQDHPELTFYKELRAMSQVTGPAASRLVGDVNTRFSEAAANYDQANIKLFQMAIAMAGFRASSGAWGRLNRQQQKFLPFDLGSYEQGDLDMAIMPRELLKPTRQEIGMENESMWRAVRDAHMAGVPAGFVLKHAGWTDDEIAPLNEAQVQVVAAQAQVAKKQDEQALTQGQALPQASGQGQ
jgi:hypothetical protein